MKKLFFYFYELYYMKYFSYIDSRNQNIHPSEVILKCYKTFLTWKETK